MPGEEKLDRVTDAIKAAEGLVRAVPIYPDAIQPGAKEAGKALATVGQAVNVALSPLAALVWGYKEFVRTFLTADLADCLKDVSPEKITTPNPMVAGPAIQSLIFAGSVPELRAMFANLLASSLYTDTAPHVHPSFVEAIRQMLPDEARILFVMARMPRVPMVEVLEVRGKQSLGPQKVYSVPFRYASFLIGQAHCERPELDAVYYDNLCRLKLTEFLPPDTFLADEPDPYGPIVAALRPRIAEIDAKPDQRAEVRKRVFQLTDFGKAFCKASVALPPPLISAIQPSAPPPAPAPQPPPTKLEDKP